MKRATIAVSILLASGIVWASSRRQGDHLSHQIDDQRGVLSERQHAAAALHERTRLAKSRSARDSASLVSLRQEAEHVSPEILSLLEHFRTGASKEPPENWRTVLEATWDASSTHVLVPKDSIKPALSSTMLRRSDEWFGMTPVAIAALGLESEQADWIGHWGTNLTVSATEWVLGKLRRNDPGSEAVLHYAVSPCSSEFNRMVESHKSLLAEAIGAERAKLVGELLLVDHRVLDGRLASAGTELSVSKGPDGKLSYQFLQGTVSAKPYRESGEVASLDQPLPVVFRTLFPGGWSEILSQEGVVLSKDK